MPENFSLVQDFAIIMAVAGGALVLFQRLRLPPILGYLLAGLIVGPFTLPNPPVEDERTIRLLADLGLVLLLFSLGLEFGWQRIRQVGGAVVLIGSIEMALVMALGYEVGTLMGWSGTEATFLGAAVAITSSALVVKVLRDSGRLYSAEGRLIVGILVVEDVAAVILLTLLSGIASTGTANLEEVSTLAWKLAVFSATVLLLGGLVIPRLLHMVARLQSEETRLIASLGLCFSLALGAEQLGISPAAGAFLMGAVLGDTQYSEDITRTMAPVRDMFAALFFVSVGMLVDLSLVAEFIVPALIVSLVVILGKSIANTAAAFFAGYDGRTALAVGTGMPQTGEFSLAMVKVGADHGVLGASIYPVVAATTAITALVYPFLFRSSAPIASLVERKSPRLLRNYGDTLLVWLRVFRRAQGVRGGMAQQVRRAGRIFLVNLSIVMIIIGVGTGVIRSASRLAELVHLQESLVGLIVGSAVIILCVPPGIAMWRELQRLTEVFAGYFFGVRSASSRLWQREDFRLVLGNSILAGVVVLLVVWTIPLVTQLFSLGQYSVAVPILFLLGMLLITGRAAYRIYRTLESRFTETFLGDSPPSPRDE